MLYDTHVQIKATNGNDSPRDWDFYNFTEFNDWYTNCISLPMDKTQNNTNLPDTAKSVAPAVSIESIGSAFKQLFPEMDVVKEALMDNLKKLQEGKVTVEISEQVNKTATNIISTTASKLKTIDILTRGKR